MNGEIVRYESAYYEVTHMKNGNIKLTLKPLGKIKPIDYWPLKDYKTADLIDEISQRMNYEKQELIDELKQDLPFERVGDEYEY